MYSQIKYFLNVDCNLNSWIKFVEFVRLERFMTQRGTPKYNYLGGAELQGCGLVGKIVKMQIIHMFFDTFNVSIAL